jgi:hypothetical protein
MPGMEQSVDPCDVRTMTFVGLDNRGFVDYKLPLSLTVLPHSEEFHRFAIGATRMISACLHHPVSRPPQQSEEQQQYELKVF